MDRKLKKTWLVTKILAPAVTMILIFKRMRVHGGSFMGESVQEIVFNILYAYLLSSIGFGVHGGVPLCFNFFFFFF